jgi:hypothetical protein
MTKGARGDLNAGCRGGFGVPWKAGIQLAEVEELLRGQESPGGQGHVEDGHGMSFGQEEAVSVGPGGIGGVKTELMEVEGGDDLRGRKRSPNMPRLGPIDHIQDLDAPLLSCAPDARD